METNVANTERTNQFYDIFVYLLWRKDFVADAHAIGCKAKDNTQFSLIF